jgi:hypothetical protein
VGAAHVLDEGLLRAAVACKLDGIVVKHPASGAPIEESIVRLADRLGVFVALCEISTAGRGEA